MDEFLLVYVGSHLEFGHVLADYNIKQGSTIFMALRLGGCGKRGVGRMKSDKTKEEVISDLEGSLCRTGTLLAGCKAPILTSAIQHMEALKIHVHGNPNHIQYMLSRCSDDQLKTLNMSFGSSGSRDYKTTIYKNMVFADDLKNMKQLSSDGDLIKTAMDELINYVLVKGYGNERGEVVWTKVQESIVDILRDRARVAGAAGAVAAGAVAAGAVTEGAEPMVVCK